MRGRREFAEGASHARPGNNVKRGGFGVESKRFEVEVEERRGRLHATIVERKVGKRVEGKREDVFSVTRLQQRGLLSSFGSCGFGGKEATKVAKEKERAAARVDITTEEVGRNLSKLGHCIVGTWNHNAAKGDDLRGWGSQLTRIWRLKGSLGLAKMERGKVLLEFEIPAEAEQVSKDGKYFSWGGRSPFREVESGDGMFEGRGKEQRSVGAGSWAACLHVGSGYSEENWGRVWGLPCDDHQTEKMEDLQWARLLVKRNGGSPPSLVEVWIEGFCYEVTLWWEIRPVIKVPATGKRGKTVVTDAKEGGDASARAGARIGGDGGFKARGLPDV
ncbi:hypothetical protein CK203_107248 [Vitis vinifera]|uniref:DUF4283 domain-containing protein n=1 Tax=Vitis vinifera TaxID=29760 RepID=A0A438BN74_VITVI|nr:hypothetical protein CK203_107248 [Vitis vinifera]